MPSGNMTSLGLTVQETFAIRGLASLAPKARLTVEAASADGGEVTSNGRSRVDDQTDLEYVRHGGILHQVLRERIAED
jgi:aconitate hydratase